MRLERMTKMYAIEKLTIDDVGRLNSLSKGF
ncbi:hypothetical protein SAMN05518846_11398 [Brevibacillus centrosporus]|uniref:Uncharacterized protein n=1 Tax=Brevibacillus centrosporus TaxID=54910 RepID=A0A1I3ZHX7_9BACL|nr:hypothetical protein SAMN05518846_11398 [Brevibacillus centrosporus]